VIRYCQSANTVLVRSGAAAWGMSSLAVNYVR
jgi:hypothetical protein